MTITLFTGSMYSSKTKKLVERAQILKIRHVNFKMFYPVRCSNGEKNLVYSRAGIEQDAIPIQEIYDIYQFLDKNIKAILIDEVQFLSSGEDDIPELISFIKRCEEDEIDLYFAGLDLDFRGEPFEVIKEIFPYADKVEKLKAVCYKCYSEDAKYSLRTKDGVPCLFSEDVLIEKSNSKYEYKPVCPKCFWGIYGR